MTLVSIHQLIGAKEFDVKLQRCAQNY